MLATIKRLKKWQIGALIALLVATLGGGLGLDLRAHGLVWRYWYSVTGEEQPFKQIVGFVSYLGNFTRPQPNVADTATPRANTGMNPMGVNTFLEDEVEPAKRERQLQMIHDAGFGWIRQQFRWDDLEISGRGNFMDIRNNPPVSAWDKYDGIVALAAKYGVGIIARLNSSPAWSQDSANQKPGYAPPQDFEDFVNYARAVATRYKGQIHYFQVWNEPNLTREWGDRPPDPIGYTDLLCRTYKALKAVDPSIVVLSATLAPTIDISDLALSDLMYLQRMYDAGAGLCFDILGAQGYGLRSGPTDHRSRPTDINFSHVTWVRDTMVANGDAAKPIWITEMAWNPVPNDPTIIQWQDWGQVTDEQDARYAVEAYQRTRAEWPWVGVACYWYFKRASDNEKNQASYYFRLVDPDFTPRPVYDALKAYGTGQSK